MKFAKNLEEATPVGGKPAPSFFTDQADSGAKGIYEARIDQSYRMTYQRLPNDTLRLRAVGKHDETLKNP